MQREGVFREMKRRRFFEKPSERATREKAEAVRRMRKLARKQAVREGLIAAPKKRIASQPRYKNRLGGHTNSYHTYSLEEALEGIAAAQIDGKSALAGARTAIATSPLSVCS